MSAALPTLADIRASHWREPVRAAYEKHLLMNTYLFRPVSFVLTWTAMRLGLSSEAVSWLSGAVGIGACIVLISGAAAAMPVGIALLWLFNLLDCVDGDLARTLRTQNPYGRFLDSVCGGIIDVAFWAVVGVAAYRHPGVLHWPDGFGHGPLLWAGVGLLTCLSFLTLELIERTFDELVRPVWDPSPRDEPEQPGAYASSGPRAVLRVIQTNMRVRETHYVLLALAAATQTVDVLLVGYLAYYTTQTLIALAIYRERGLAVARGRSHV